jgi:hypothetical protein
MKIGGFRRPGGRRKRLPHLALKQHYFALAVLEVAESVFRDTLRAAFRGGAGLGGFDFGNFRFA